MAHCEQKNTSRRTLLKHSAGLSALAITGIDGFL